MTIGIQGCAFWAPFPRPASHYYMTPDLWKTPYLGLRMIVEDEALKPCAAVVSKPCKTVYNHLQLCSSAVSSGVQMYVASLDGYFPLLHLISFKSSPNPKP